MRRDLIRRSCLLALCVTLAMPAGAPVFASPTETDGLASTEAAADLHTTISRLQQAVGELSMPEEEPAVETVELIDRVKRIKGEHVGAEPGLAAKPDTPQGGSQVSRADSGQEFINPDASQAALLAATTTMFSDGFEVGGYPWDVESAGWGATTYRKSEGSRSLYCAGGLRDAPGPYLNNMDTWVFAGPFDLSTVTIAEMAFDAWFKTELYYDVLAAGAITGDGEAYSIVWMSGESGGWGRYGVDLDSVCGESEVYLFFNFASDESVTSEGVYLDRVVLSGSDATVIDVQGASRHATAVEASKQAFPQGSDVVVIATAANWPDALGGSTLAGILDAPILLTDRDRLPQVVVNEIVRLGASYAVILGGTGAVGTPVESHLVALMGSTDDVVRIFGSDRYETADKIAFVSIGMQDEYFDGTAFVATGGNFPDSLAAAPIAVSQGWPLLLAHPTKGLSNAAKQLVLPDVSDVVILGGTGAVSSATEQYLVNRYGRARVDRISGTSRYDTAAAVANYAVKSGAMNWNHRWNRVGITTGANFPDALAGGVLQGRRGSVMLLTESARLSPAARSALVANSGQISVVTFFGGAGAVSQPVRSAALSAAGVAP